MERKNWVSYQKDSCIFCFDALIRNKNFTSRVSTEKEQGISSNSSDRFRCLELILIIWLWDYFVIYSYSKKPYEAISQTCSFEIVLFMDWYKQAFLIHSISPFGFEKYEQTSFINYFKHVLIIVIIFPILASEFISHSLSSILHIQ